MNGAEFRSELEQAAARLQGKLRAMSHELLDLKTALPAWRRTRGQRHW